MPNIKRGRSQVLFKYLPGSVFTEKYYWYKVDSLKLNEIDKSKHLLHEVYSFVNSWNANSELEVNLYPQKDDNYLFGEVEEVSSSLYPLVFYCNNRQCQNTHSYSSLDELRKKNPTLSCEFCKEGKLRQYPYALVHLNGDMQPLNIKLNEGGSWKEKHNGIRMNDTRRFTTATWYNYKIKRSLGELGTKFTSLPINLTMRQNNKRFLGGIHLSEGDIYYPALRSFVNLEHEILAKRKEHENFSYIQLGAMMQLSSINQKEFFRNFEEKSNQELIKKMLGNAPDDNSKRMILQLAGITNVDEFLIEDKVVQDINKLFNSNVPIETIKNDRSLHEFVFSFYENGGESLETKIAESRIQMNIVQETVYLEAKTEANNLGLDSILLLEKFPVLMLGIGYTRKSFDRTRAILNPFKQKVGSKDKVIIPVLKNENEAIVFKLDPLRVLAWLTVNDFIDRPNKSILDKSTAHAYMYERFRFAEISEEDLSRLKPADIKKDKNLLASIMSFRLLHTFIHMLFQSGKSLIGLDVDSMSEYLFPSSLSGAIYVSKLQGGGMGALIAAYDNDLAKWLRFTYDKSHTCLYDPVCREHNGACHACVYLKFSCRHFNHSLNRNLLTGGKIVDYDDMFPIQGYYSRKVDDQLTIWGN